MESLPSDKTAILKKMKKQSLWLFLSPILLLLLIIIVFIVVISFSKSADNTQFTTNAEVLLGFIATNVIMLIFYCGFLALIGYLYLRDVLVKKSIEDYKKARKMFMWGAIVAFILIFGRPVLNGLLMLIK